ncbi:Translation initiation factor IF-2 [Prochlorococcus marinus str. MIT 9215]|uniref:Translation initiation factor IF-2 n=1 Tax=Prochlorococcus marinus (strain MIT 9215) TaxID=93060 RepID=IF2_PROM2|nr:translation initiation factor IF-2 [Prochlorococcus marinus]A8G6Z5.1 RecName: Full=Translation initiation factor IF-2 [Prochlorococcus marinus str. MIT 9215]ABV51376.1 Translation initiation factor IF-2 [Prochlorococcus marinus str. MIT 9215]
MTISDKIRIYELSRDLNLDNKDILGAAQKLSISVKSHSSSISAEEAEKIKNLINKKNPDKKILSIKKPSIKKDNYKQNKEDKSSLISSVEEKPFKDNPEKKPLLKKPLNKPESLKIISNQPKSLNKPTITNSSQSQANLTNQNLNSKTSQNLNQDKRNFRNNLTPPIKSPTKPPIQLIAKPKNTTKNVQSNESSQNILNSGGGRQISNKPDQNSSKSKTKNINNRMSPPELVGAPIRREGPNKQNNKQKTSFKQTVPNRPGMLNRPGLRNKPSDQGRPGSFNRQTNTNRPGAPSSNKPGMPNRPGLRNKPSDQGRPGSFNRQVNTNRSGAPIRPGMPNRPGSKFNGPKSPGMRKPVSPNELLKLQKTNKSENDKQVINNNEKQNSETTKQKVKAPNSRPHTAPNSKKLPHRTFSNNSKKPGKTDWDDSAKLEALRNKNPQKQRQKVRIIGENDDSLTSETSGYSGEKFSILSASLARPKKEKSDESKSQKTIKQFKKKKKETTRQRQKRRAMELKAAKEAKQIRPEMIIVPEDNLTVQELADKLSLESSEIIKSLFFKGITATVTQSLDLATIETVAEEFGVPVLQDDIQEAAEKTVDMIESEDLDNLIKRPPVITVMGHVDHGKTSLLDSIRESRVASGEAGGITQHIGAYQVEFEHESKKKKLTFLDTPGHEAFTAMRARGTKVTDVAVLVVAADDGCRPQTLEAISHARAAKVPIVVAINKIDKEGASPDRVKQELSEKNLIAEDWGGDTVMVPVSAIKKQNINKLLEMILLVSEVEDLQANPDRFAKGTVIEAHLDKAKGPVATLLVQNGTLKSGDVLAAGSVLGKIRAMVDEHGNRIKDAGPSFPVEALGFSEVPTAGDEFEVYPDEKTARAIVGERATDARATKLAQQMASRRVSLSSLSTQANDGELKELNLILKADVQGSVEAILGSLEQLPKNEVQVRVLLSAPGEITETDIDLAAASGSVIIGFNTSLASGAKKAADANDVDVREYEVIYKLLEDIQLAMEGLLEPDLVEESLGKAEVRATFSVGKGAIAGCYIQTGKLQRNCSLRVIRSEKVIFEGNLDSLKRSKDDVKEVNTGFECGVGCDKFSSWIEGDIIEAFKFVTKKRTLTQE